MTPEERALEFYDTTKFLYGGVAYDIAVPALAAAIRAAENDALERAAQVVDKQDPDCCYVNARDVRALKHPVE